MSALRTRLIALGLASALAIIPLFESRGGKPDLVPYVDPVGIVTDCYGHTGNDVLLGKINSLQACEDKLDADVLEAYNTVTRCAGVPLSRGELNAYTSFAFNVGPGGKGRKDGFCTLRSGRVPTFLTQLRAGNRIAACWSLLKWDKAGGTPLRGLTIRRGKEAELCLKDLPGP